MPTYETFLDQVEANSLESDFKTKRGVTLPGGGTADLAASRTKFFWPAVMFFSQHLLVRYLPNATVQDFQRLFDAGFRYGKSVNRVPLFRGLQFGYFIGRCSSSRSSTNSRPAAPTSTAARRCGAP